jgi:2-amino-4-hydroxy-6-hydroxymethyldihydropteridine diphosphokinase
LKELESKLGRVNTDNRYGPRTIDLDILVWNGEVVDEEVYEREFLRKSIKELLPDLDL